MRVKWLDTIALNALVGSLVWWRKSLPLGMKPLPIQLQGLHHAARTKNTATYHTAYISYLLEKGRKSLEYLDMLTHEFGYIQ